MHIFYFVTSFGLRNLDHQTDHQPLGYCVSLICLRDIIREPILKMSSHGNYYSYVIIFLLFTKIAAQISVEEMKLHDDVLLARSRRQLLFPNATLLQFNMGVGTPTPEKSIMVNWAFQANFVLPWNVTQIPLDIIHANSGYTGLSREAREIEEKDEDQQYESDAKLFHFYKYVEDALNGFGYNGTACILRALCQFGAEPIHSDDEEDLLHELTHFVLNPNNDADGGEIPGDRETRPYIEAYNRGSEQQNCISIYKNCSISLIDLFTKVHENIIEEA